MSVDDEIREAVLAGNFELAKQLAEGDKPQPVKKKRGRPKKVEVVPEVEQQPKRKVALPNFKNTYVDSGELTEIEKKEKKMYVKPPVERTRPVATKIEAICAGCGIHEFIWPSEYILIGEDRRYRCNKCAGSVR